MFINLNSLVCYIFVQIFVGLLIALAVNQIDTATISRDGKPNKTACIIGAGAAGLVSAKYSLERGFDVIVYEQTPQIGGIWFYTDKTGTDRYGVRIYSPMYQGLR